MQAYPVIFLRRIKKNKVCNLCDRNKARYCCSSDVAVIQSHKHLKFDILVGIIILSAAPWCASADRRTTFLQAIGTDVALCS